MSSFWAEEVELSRLTAAGGGGAGGARARVRGRQARARGGFATLDTWKYPWHRFHSSLSIRTCFCEYFARAVSFLTFSRKNVGGAVSVIFRLPPPSVLLPHPDRPIFDQAPSAGLAAADETRQRRGRRSVPRPALHDSGIFIKSTRPCRL